MTNPTSGFQSSVNIFTALGVPGDLAFDGPIRAHPFNLNSSGQPQTFGFAFTTSSASGTGGNPDPTQNSSLAANAQVGGTGPFAGILVNSKEYASYGTSSGSLNPTLNLPDNTIASLLTMGEVFVVLPGPAIPGDQVYYNTTTGALNTTSPTFIGTASISATTLNVSAQTFGNSGTLGIGSVVSGPNVLGGTIITALGSGTGGAGTYTINLTQTAAASNISATTVAPAGYLAIPSCIVSYYNVQNVAGLAVIKLTD